MNEQWLIAIGTVVLACVALFQDFFRSWLKTPKLEVSTGNVFPYCMKLLFRKEGDPNTQADGYALRVAVKNIKPWYRIKTRAEQVEFYLSKLSKKGNDGLFHPVQDFEPTNLIWSHSFVHLDNISPNMERYCFIGRMVQPMKRHHFEAFDDENLPMDDTCFRIDTVIARHTKKHIIPPGTYRLDCLIGSANTKAFQKTFEIYISGDWFDDETKMFEKGLGIKIIEY